MLMIHVHRSALFGVLLLLLRGNLLAQTAETPETSAAPQSDTYLGKAFSEAKGEICFELPDGLVDWEGLAKASLGKWHFDHPDKKYLGRREPEAGSRRPVRFRAPVPQQVSDSEWQILHEGGVLILPPQLLRVEVVYRVDERFEVKGRPFSWGRACGVVGLPKVRAAFVVSGAGEKWSAEPTKWSANADGRFSIKTPVGRYTLKPPDFAIPRIRKVLLFRPAGLRPRVLAAWSFDSKGWNDFYCVSAFSLYELRADGTTKMIAENGYGCDI